MMMRKFDLENLSTEELWELNQQVTELLTQKITAEKLELERRLAALNGSSKFRLESGLNGSGVEAKPRRKYPRVFPKYRNPALPSQTWSGRGKKPRWLVAELKAGRRMDDFKIKSGE